VSLDEQADRVGGARRVLVCSSGQPERAISASGRWVLKDLPSEVRFGRFRAKRSIGQNRPSSGSTRPKFSRACAAMQEIADWLTRLGLPEYADASAENGIDVSVLPHLTDQDLKDIGVLLGHRRKRDQRRNCLDAIFRRTETTLQRW
jgi:hypothetical protein